MKKRTEKTATPLPQENGNSKPVIVRPTLRIHEPAEESPNGEPIKRETPPDERLTAIIHIEITINN